MEDNGYFKHLISHFTDTEERMVAFSFFKGMERINVSYLQFSKDILCSAGYFKQHNIHNQHVALLSPTCYELFVAFFSIIASGNVAVMLNPTLPADLLKRQCEIADVAFVCGEDSTLFNLQSGFANIPQIPFTNLRDFTPLTLDEVHNDPPDQTVLLIFTSGTTGKSKAVELSSSNLCYAAGTLDASFAAGGMDTALSIVPRYHIGGIKGALAMFQRHKTLYIGRGVGYIFMDMPIFNPTLVFLVPAMVDNLVKMLKRANNQLEREKIIGKNLRRISVGGAALKASSARYLMDLGLLIDNGYGLSECTGSAIWGILDQEHIASIGKPFSQTECCIKDGEILVKGPAVMKGYYKDLEATASVIDSGWLHTGDMGYCDESGYYYLTGRKKNVIILSNGENINPEEIEEDFGECENILESLVYSDGKGICADIYTENQAAAVAFIRNYNNSMPMDHQVYKVYYFATPLEKTGSGKIKRKVNIYE